MTYEQAVATAFLKALVQKGKRKQIRVGDITTRNYAWRRLRVRAGLVP